DRVAVDVQMLRGDRRGDVRAALGDEAGSFGGGDMLEHDLQCGEEFDDAAQQPVDENRLAVKNVDLWIGDLAVDAQDHADCLHPLERRVDVADVGDPAGAVGGRARGIELGGDPYAASIAASELVRIRLIGQVGGHQRRE